MSNLYTVSLALDTTAAIRPGLLEAVRRIVESEGHSAVTAALAPRGNGRTGGVPYCLSNDHPSRACSAGEVGQTPLFEGLKKAEKSVGHSRSRLSLQ